MKQFTAFILTILYATYALAGIGSISGGDAETMHTTGVTVSNVAEKATGFDHFQTGIQIKKPFQHIARSCKMKMPRASAVAAWVTNVSYSHPNIATHYSNHSTNPHLPHQALYLQNRALLI